MGNTRYQGRRQRQEFVSHADTQELRQYQVLASKFPPLRHSELLELSHAFVKGRNAQVSLDESRIVDVILGGDWSDENILVHKDEVIAAYATNIKWLSDKPSATDIISSFLKRCADDLFAHANDNLIEDIFWEEPITLAGCYPAMASMGEDEFSRARGIALKALRERVAAVKPKDTPKDVIDRWRACKRDLSSRYLLHVQLLPHGSKAAMRKASRTAEIGSQALSDIVNHNLQLAMSRVGRIMKNNPRAQKIGVSDLIGAANMGLILGARQFDPDRGRKFSTYAAYHIDGQLLEILAIEDGKSGIKGVSPHEQKQLSTIMGIKRSFENIYGRAPSVTEIQSLSGISKAVVEKRLSTPILTTQSINSPVKQGDDDSVMLSEVIASEVTIDKEVNAQDMIDMMRDLKEEILSLSPIQRKILLCKSGIQLEGEDPVPDTAKALSAEIGISTSEIASKYADILTTLKQRLSQRGWEASNLPFEE